MSATTIVTKPVQSGSKLWGLLFAVAVLLLVLVLPTPEGLPVAGQRVLAVFGFAVIVWVSEALDYAVSAVVIAALLAFLLGLSPDPANPHALLGTVQGLTIAVSGFGNTALTLVAAALFLATAMTITGLDRRIALGILSLVGVRTSRVVIGGILVTIVLSFLVPSATARAAAVVPIMLGIVLAFGAEKRSRLAALVMLTTVQAVSVWNVGVKTAAAQNMVAIGFVQKMLHQDITWLQWLVAAAPFSIAMSVGLYFVMMWMLPPETATVPGGADAVARARAALGPMSGKEKGLLTVSLILLCFWATEGVLHPFDSSTTTTAAVALLFLPGVGVMTWKEAQPRIPWGTLVLFGIGISLGTALLQTKAATWLANLVVVTFGPDSPRRAGDPGGAGVVPDRHPSGICQRDGAGGVDDPDRHRGVGEGHTTPGISIIGMTMVLQFVVSFGFVLPVNSPQGMVAYGTETFMARDFIRTGLVLTVLAYLLTLLFGATYWQWLGYV